VPKGCLSLLLWVMIAVAMGLCSYFWHPALYLIAVMFIGSRQHALIIMGHDASHYQCVFPSVKGIA
jgi:fatty acid desaturase